MNSSPTSQPVTHPLDQSATMIAADIRAGRVTAETIVSEALRRARAVATLNAFTVIREDQALAAARAADRAVAAGAALGARRRGGAAGVAGADDSAAG